MQGFAVVFVFVLVFVFVQITRIALWTATGASARRETSIDPSERWIPEGRAREEGGTSGDGGERDLGERVT